MSPPPGTPTKAHSSLRVPRAACLCDGRLGSLALSVCICLLLPVDLGLLEPGSPSLPFMLSFSPFLFQCDPGCHGNAAAGTRWGGGREPHCRRSLQPPPSPMPGTCRAPWLSLIWGDLGASAGLLDFSLDNGGWGRGQGVGVRVQYWGAVASWSGEGWMKCEKSR